jgi:uncharacterized protein
MAQGRRVRHHAGVRLRIVVLSLALGAAAFVPGTRAVARAFLFPVAHARGNVAAAKVPDGFEEHVLVAKDGVRVHALGLAAPSGARTIVHFHNNRETAGASADVARALRARGFGVLLVEYRGYGASHEGAPSEEGLYLDAECALDMLAARGVGPERVVLWGTSLGTGVAAEMARRGRGGGLVLVTPYTSIPGLVTNVAPMVPAGALVPDHFDTLAKSKDIHVPTVVIHGDADEIVPFWMGERIAGAIAGARFVRVEGGHHGDLFARDGEHILAELTALAR